MILPDLQSTLVDKLAPLPSIVWNIGPKYTHIRELGSGAYGTVCEAIENETKKHVAIKKYSAIFNDPVLCQRTLREIEILCEVNHPYIVKPLDIIIRTETFDVYLVMEIAESDFRKLFKSKLYLTSKQVKVMMYRLLVVLNYLHSCGIVHRDIKPANILVNSDSSIKLCDFSLGRSIVGLQSSKFDCGIAVKKCFVIDSSIAESSTADKEVESTVAPDFCSDFQNFKIHNKMESGVAFKPKALEEESTIALEKKRRLSEFSGKKIKERKILLTECKKLTSKLKRELTGHVGTRWYRPPEIILLEKVYSSSMDIWATGCVFAELLGMVKENIEDYHNRHPLFQGTSCFPLSPSPSPIMDVGGFPIASGDQMQIIINFKGTPSATDISFINDTKAYNYVRSFPKIERKKISDIYPKESKDVIGLLNKMLTFNPHYRMTAKEGLKQKYFADIKDRSQEYESTEKIELLADKYIDKGDLKYVGDLIFKKILTKVKS